MTKFISLLVLVSFVACVSTTEIEPNQEVSIKAGGESNFNLDNRKVTLKILEITDARCPAEVQCVRAGEAIVKFNLSIDKDEYLNQEICLQCGEINVIPDNVKLGSFTLELKEVNPGPTTTNQNDTKSAVFVFN